MNPESGTINYTYDANGNLATKVDARSITTSYTYDKLNRVTERSYATPSPTPSPSQYQNSPTVNYYYDNVTNSKGKLTKSTSSVSTTEYTSFDILGRVTGHKQTTDSTDYTTGYTYKLSGALNEQTYPSGRVVKNELDVSGDLASVTSKENASAIFKTYANDFNYNAAGAVTTLRLGNGRFESTTFNSRLQPTQIGLGTSETTQNILKLEYGYGTTANNGDVISQTITVPTVGSNTGFAAVQTYTYDELNRLKSATENVTPIGGSQSQSWKQTYTFDRYGNRRFDFTGSNTTSPASNCTEAVCNPTVSTTNNRLTSTGWQYDNSGNTTRDGEYRTFTYDGENKQTLVKNSSDATIGEYFYDGDGKRVKKVVPSTGEATAFVYDAAGKLIGEYSTIVANSTDAKVAYLTNDHLGSPRITTDATGQTTSRRDFMPYGEEIARSNYGSDNLREKFATYKRDNETELDFAEARMYAKSLGRFLTVDPIKFKRNRATDPQRINLYVYVRNSPFKFVDPNGEDVNLVNKTEEQRKKALESILANMTKAEAANVDVRFNEKKGKYEVFIKDSGAVDVSKASKGYKDLVDRVGNKDLQLNFTLLGKNDTVKIDEGTVSHRDLISPGGFAGGGFVQEQEDGSFAVVVAEGGFPDGVEATFRLCKSAKDVKVPFPDFIITAHELFSETYKYTPEGKQKGLVFGSSEDNDYVINSENQYRDFHGIPRRNGKDHGSYKVEAFD